MKFKALSICALILMPILVSADTDTEKEKIPSSLEVLYGKKVKHKIVEIDKNINPNRVLSKEDTNKVFLGFLQESELKEQERIKKEAEKERLKEIKNQGNNNNVNNVPSGYRNTRRKVKSIEEQKRDFFATFENEVLKDRERKRKIKEEAKRLKEKRAKMKIQEAIKGKIGFGSKNSKNKNNMNLTSSKIDFIINGTSCIAKSCKLFTSKGIMKVGDLIQGEERIMFITPYLLTTNIRKIKID